jgi:hypothetical protein
MEVKNLVNRDNVGGYSIEELYDWLQPIVGYLDHLDTVMDGLRPMNDLFTQILSVGALAGNDVGGRELIIQACRKRRDSVKEMLNVKSRLESRVFDVVSAHDIDDEQFAHLCESLSLLSESLFFLENSMTSIFAQIDQFITNQTNPTTQESAPEDKSSISQVQPPAKNTDYISVKDLQCQKSQPSAFFSPEKCLEYLKKCSTTDVISIINALTKSLQLRENGKIDGVDILSDVKAIERLVERSMVWQSQGQNGDLELGSPSMLKSLTSNISKLPPQGTECAKCEQSSNHCVMLLTCVRASR